MCREGSRRSRSRWVMSVSERGRKWEGMGGWGDGGMGGWGIKKEISLPSGENGNASTVHFFQPFDSGLKFGFVASLFGYFLGVAECCCFVDC